MGVGVGPSPVAPAAHDRGETGHPEARSEELAGHPAAQRFSVTSGAVRRVVSLRAGTSAVSTIGPAPNGSDEDLESLADLAFVRLAERPGYQAGERVVRFADLFAGCGALSVGVMEAARALGRGSECVLAVDRDARALEVNAKSLGTSTLAADLAKLIDGKLGARATASERKVAGAAGHLDVLVAGPPCQGHSALNNHSRHDDDRNDLYLRVVRFAEIARPMTILIENVASITRDRRRSAARAREHLDALGYSTDEGLVDLNALGVPQLRRRHVLVACGQGCLPLRVEDVLGVHGVAEPGRRTVGWAISDLQSVEGGPFDQPSIASPANRDRMEWLHHNDSYDLPNEMRPPCHRDDHTYKSMYGRLRWDRPAQTITSGYGSMGQGRYVHPRAPRTLTPHEAARLQFIPDFFQFEIARHRSAWAQMIGNAAPMKLSYSFALEALR